MNSAPTLPLNTQTPPTPSSPTPAPTPTALTTTLALDPANPQAATHAARAVKHAIVGNPTNKRTYLNHGVLPRLIACVEQGDAHPALSEHAVAALGSLSPYVPHEHLPAYLDALLHCLFSPHPRPVHAAARALKLLLASVPHSPSTTLTTLSPRLVTPPVAQRLVSLLNAPDEGVADVCAVIIARSVYSEQHATAYTAANAIPRLIGLLNRTMHERCIEACINALAALARHSSSVSFTLTAPHNILPVLMLFTRTPVHSLRLASCRLLTILHTAGCLPTGYDATVTIAIVNLLSISSPHHLLPDATKTLAELVLHTPELQRVATDASAVIKLVALLSATGNGKPYSKPAARDATNFLLVMAASQSRQESSTTANPTMDITMCDSNTNAVAEPQSPLLRANILTALAALMQGYDPARDAVIAQDALPAIVDGLSDEQHPIVKASMECIRYLSRSVKILRRDISDERIGKTILTLVRSDNVDIQRVASATMCNLVLEFSPMRTVILNDGGTTFMIDLLKSTDAHVRENALWALKNLLFKAEAGTKNAVLSKLGYDCLRTLFSDKEVRVRELAMTVVRNLAYSASADKQNIQLDALFSVTGERLVSLLSDVLKSSLTSVEMAVQALYVVCNIASGTEQHKEYLFNSDIPQLILQWTSHEDERARIAAVWCAINLSWKERRVVAPQGATRAMRRAFRTTTGRLILRRQHLPLPSSAQGRRILERHVSGSVERVRGDGGSGGRGGSANEDGGMWDGDGDEDGDGGGGGSGGGEDAMEEEGVEGVPSESDHSESSGGGEGQGQGEGRDGEDEEAMADEDEDDMAVDDDIDDSNDNGGDDASVARNGGGDVRDSAENGNDDNVGNEMEGSGGEGGVSGGVSGGGGGEDGGDGGGPSDKSRGHEWRIERLRELGFEGRLRSLVNDPHIEVQGRARAALELFDCDDMRPLDYNPPALLDGNHATSMLVDRSLTGPMVLPATPRHLRSIGAMFRSSP